MARSIYTVQATLGLTDGTGRWYRETVCTATTKVEATRAARIALQTFANVKDVAVLTPSGDVAVLFVATPNGYARIQNGRVYNVR